MLADGGEGSDSPGESNTVVLDGNLHLSDGVESTWPAIGGEMDYQQIDDSRWRSDLAQRWIAETGAQEEGVSYTIDRLPEGYCVFDRDRASHSGRDPFLYGHPSGRYFQSRTTFYPHFYWLVTGRKEPCKCHICLKMKGLVGEDGVKKRRRRRTKAEMEAARALESAGRDPNLAERPKRAEPETPTKTDADAQSNKKDEKNIPRDQEGAPDYWKMYIMKMKEEGHIDEEIDHRFNLDWVLTHEWLETYFVRLKLQASFIPRRGETVLWAEDIDGPLIWNDDIKTHMLQKDGAWVRPNWRAGVITQTPDRPANFLDIIRTEETDHSSIDTWGFRVETLPDPLTNDKSLSLQFKYLPLQCIKPFNTYERYLHGIPRENIHPSFENAMTTMASYSLLSHIRFKGKWPKARVYSRGIFIGAELVAMNDTVRLKPAGLQPEDMEEEDISVRHEDHDPVDVMVIEEIWLELDGCNADPEDVQIAELIQPRLSGKVYTRDPRRLERFMPFAKDPLKKLTYDEVSNAFRQVGMSGYGDWYAVAGGKTSIISPSLVLGRCFEPEATTLHFNTNRLDYDLHGVMNGRRYSTQVDTRIPIEGDWFWGDCRVNTLGLETMNGVEVGREAQQRESPERWQAILRILSGDPYSDSDIRKAELPRRVGRPRKFASIQKTSKLVSTGLGVSQNSSSEAVNDPDDEDDEVNSEMDLSPSELLAPVPFRGGTEESEGGDYSPDHNN